MRLLYKDTILRNIFVDGYYKEDGSWEKGAFTQETIKCCIEPYPKGSVRKVEEMGVRNEDCRKIRSKTPLLTAEDREDRQADVVTFDGYDWEIIDSQPWTTIKRLSHYECVAYKQDKDYENGGD